MWRPGRVHDLLGEVCLNAAGCVNEIRVLLKVRYSAPPRRSCGLLHPPDSCVNRLDAGQELVIPNVQRLDREQKEATHSFGSSGWMGSISENNSGTG